MAPKTWEETKLRDTLSRELGRNLWKIMQGCEADLGRGRLRDHHWWPALASWIETDFRCTWCGVDFMHSLENRASAGLQRLFEGAKNPGRSAPVILVPACRTCEALSEPILPTLACLQDIPADAGELAESMREQILAEARPRVAAARRRQNLALIAQAEQFKTWKKEVRAIHAWWESLDERARSLVRTGEAHQEQATRSGEPSALEDVEISTEGPSGHLADDPCGNLRLYHFYSSQGAPADTIERIETLHALLRNLSRREFLETPVKRFEEVWKLHRATYQRLPLLRCWTILRDANDPVPGSACEFIRVGRKLDFRFHSPPRIPSSWFEGTDLDPEVSLLFAHVVERKESARAVRATGQLHSLSLRRLRRARHSGHLASHQVTILREITRAVRESSLSEVFLEGGVAAFAATSW